MSEVRERFHMAAKRFFAAVNLDAYNGPIVTLNSPENGSVISGKVKVTASVIDILPLRVAEMYVDGELHLAITSGPPAAPWNLSWIHRYG